MAEVKRKISLKDVPVDEIHGADQGFVNLRLQWIVTDKVGAKQGCLGYVEFLTDSSHELHTHPNTEEAFYIIDGHGLAQCGDEVFEINTGDTVFVPKGEKHYFRNLDKTKPMKAIWLYFSATNLENAGHVRLGG